MAQPETRPSSGARLLAQSQIEIYFSVIQRKVLTPNDFADLDALVERLLAFQERYEQVAEPFAWKFTRRDLDRLLDRLAEHQPL